MKTRGSELEIEVDSKDDRRWLVICKDVSLNQNF